MAYIQISDSQFLTTANQIYDYLSFMKEKMKEAEQRVDELSAAWQGADEARFRAQWSSLTAPGSTYSQMVESLTNYSNYLRYAEKQYNGAQLRAKSRAGLLPWY